MRPSRNQIKAYLYPKRHGNSTASEITSHPRPAPNIGVIPHQNPDGDALGSCLAWSSFLRKKGHSSDRFPNDYPSFLEWMPGLDEIVLHSTQQDKAQKIIAESDILFTLDFNDLLRIDALGPWVEKSKATLVMIDHHEKPKEYATLSLSFPPMSSTAEIIYHLINQWILAPSIGYGNLSLHWNNDRYRVFPLSSTTADTHRAIAHLMECGAPHTGIHQSIHDSYTFDRVRLLGMSLTNLNKLENIPAVYLSLSQQELSAYNYQKGDTEGFVNYGLRIKDIQLAVILIENRRERKIKMSFRSKGNSQPIPLQKLSSRRRTQKCCWWVSFDTMETTQDRLVAAIQEWKNHFE